MKTRVTNRNDRLEVIEKLLFKHSAGLRAVEIARECGVDRRTIYRDLSMLQESGVPISQKNGRFLVNREYYSATLRLNVHESLALVLALRLAIFHSEQSNPHIISILQKLSENLPGISGRHVAFMTNTLLKVSVDRGFVSVLETMNRAWAEERFVELWYSSSRQGRTLSREFAPYFMEMSSDGEIFAVGYDSLTQRIRTLRLRRIMRARLLRTSFEVPAQFNPQRYLAHVWGGGEDDNTEATETTSVMLRVSATMSARILHQRNHDIDSANWLGDGRCELVMTCYDPERLLPWIRSLGKNVEVIQPESLRQALAEEAEYLRKLYRSDGNQQRVISP